MRTIPRYMIREDERIDLDSILEATSGFEVVICSVEVTIEAGGA